MATVKPKSKFMQPMKLTKELEAVVGTGPMARTEVTKKLWAYIKKNSLQDAKVRRNINPDEKLQKIFGGKKAVNMFEMTKLVNKHLS
jgi:upstream activation factor subunit UAF30